MKNSDQNVLRRRLLGGTACLLAVQIATGSVPLLAQDTSAQDDEGDRLEEVVVTGSRIPRRDLVANSPVNVVGAEEIALQSTVEIDRVLDALPQTVSTNGPSTNNPGNGTANVNLRNLTTGTNAPVRTLVLVNSRRFVGESSTGVVDLNNIPAALIERIEVVTGGASAVYGSDAMAGVVNFILKDDFDGAQIAAQYGLTQEGDGERYSIDFTLGTNFADGKGNVVIHGSYFDREQLTAGAREFSAVQLSETTDTDGNPIFAPGGSSRIPQGRFTGSGFNVLVQDDGSVRPYTAPADEYNFAPDNNLLLPLERWTIGAIGNYQLNEDIELFAEMNYANNRVERQLAPTPFAESGFEFDLNNPFMPDELRALYAANDTDGDGIVSGSIFRRMTEAGPRVSADTRNLYRFVGGLRGELDNGMNWEVFYNFGRSEETQRQQGNIVISRFQQGLLVDPDNPTQCANTAGGCVVLNPFGAGNFTQEMVDFTRVAATNITTVQQQQVAGNLAGDLIELPAGPLGVAVGVEYRKETAENQPDTFLATGDIDGFNAGLPTTGSFDVAEIYAEAIVPILANVAGAEYLGLEAGVRFSDYSTAGGVTSYKIGGEWRPIEDLKIRGLYQRAVRAPNINELFLGQSNSFPGATDFCNDTADRTQAEADFCVQMGVPADRIAGFQQEDAQVEVLLGGNPELFEETSDTWSLGFVYTPEAVPGLMVSADFYSIDVEDAIATFGGGLQSTIDACNIALDINDVFCQALTARRADGQLEMVPLFNQNIANLSTKGVDFQAGYGFDIGEGSLDIIVNGVRVIEREVQGSPLLDPIDCAGVVGVRLTCGRADPKWRFTTRVTYRLNEFTASLRHRYLDGVTDERIVTGAATPATLLVPEIGSEQYFDLTLNYRLNDGLMLFTTIDNMLDNDPPVFGRGAAGQFNTDAGTYDVLGRRFTFGVRANF